MVQVIPDHIKGGEKAYTDEDVGKMLKKQRGNIIFKEAVKIAITPMISSFLILNHVDVDSEESILGYGISLILLNIWMYFVTPIIVIIEIRKKF